VYPKSAIISLYARERSQKEALSHNMVLAQKYTGFKKGFIDEKD
jgi:hypothetical protein